MKSYFLFIFFLLVSIVTSGCLKDGFGFKNKYFFSCTIFKEHIIEAKEGSTLNIGGFYNFSDVSHMYISASPEGNDLFVEYFSILIMDSLEIEPGTIYSNLPGAGIVQPALQLSFSYFISFSSLYRAASIYEISEEVPGLKPFFVHITEVNDSYISGTFHGTVYKHNTSGVTTFENPVSVKDGKFKVPRKP